MAKKQQGVIGQILDQMAQDIARDVAKNAAGVIIDLKNRAKDYKSAAGDALDMVVCRASHTRVVRIAGRLYKIRFKIEPYREDDDDKEAKH
jgi:hypothetical protein